MPKVSALVVGAGLAGLSAAYSLASQGIDTLVVERGDYPGSKTITGGRLYFHPVKDFFPELWKQAPWERHVVKETLTIADKDASMSIDFTNQAFNKEPYHSYTVLAAKFNRWFAQQVVAKGCKVISKYKVDDLIIEDGKVKGVIVNGAKIEADVVIAADGIMSQLAEKAGLRTKFHAHDYAVGTKEVIEIGAKAVEDRFSVTGDEGASRLFMGHLTRGMLGGGFIYTNKESISIGIVLGIEDLAKVQPTVTPLELLEEFKSRPEIAPLVRGGESVEYSAHVLSESGLKGVPKLFTNGMIVTGDAAGLTMNLGITVRGMDYAIASGALAAKAVAIAKAQNDFSATTLARYQDFLKESFVLKDFETFKKAPEVFHNKNIFVEYPKLACNLFGSLMTIDAGPKAKLSSTAIKQIMKAKKFRLLKDVFGMRRI